MDVCCLRDWQGHGSGSGTLRGKGHGGHAHTGWPEHSGARGTPPAYHHTHTTIHTPPHTPPPQTWSPIWGAPHPDLWPFHTLLCFICPIVLSFHRSIHYHLRCQPLSPLHCSVHLLHLLSLLILLYVFITGWGVRSSCPLAHLLQIHTSLYDKDVENWTYSVMQLYIKDDGDGEIP